MSIGRIISIGLISSYAGLASLALAEEDKNYPHRPPIRESVTIYTEGDDSSLEETDIDSPAAYTSFPDNYPHGSRVLRNPVQIWPMLDRSFHKPEGLGQVTSNENGWPLPSVEGYTRIAELEGIVCDILGKPVELNAKMYERGESLITLYSSGKKVVAYTTHGLDEKTDGVFIVDGRNNNQFNMRSSEETHLCGALELSVITSAAMELKK